MEKRKTAFTTVCSIILLAMILVLGAAFSIAAQAAEKSADNTGTYLYESKDTVIARINAIRKEACDEGLPDPRDPSKTLKASDYVPVKWSAALEKNAQTEAANGTNVTTVAKTDRPLSAALDAIYDGKQAWNSQEATANAYASLINPDNKTAALAAYTADGENANVAAELSTSGSDDESQVVTKDTAAETPDEQTVTKKTEENKSDKSSAKQEKSSKTQKQSAKAATNVSKQIAYISVNTKPNKTAYKTGDKLKLTGGTILAHYTDGTVKTIAMTARGVSVTPKTLTQQGSTAIIVIYNGNTTSFYVDVAARATQGIKVSQKTVRLKVGQTKTISATVFPLKAYDRRVFWKTNNANVAAFNAEDQSTLTKVHDFLFGSSEDHTTAQSAGSTDITGLKAGKTTVTAITDNGKTATINVIVK